jgi:hypothetical protein
MDAIVAGAANDDIDVFAAMEGASLTLAGARSTMR